MSRSLAVLSVLLLAACNQSSPMQPANVAPVAAFTTSCVDAVPNTQAHCSLRSTSTDVDGSVVQWAWNVESGSSNDTRPEWVQYFGVAGTWKVSLKVTDDAGASDSTSSTVTVQ